MSMEAETLKECNFCQTPVLDYQPGVTSVEDDGATYHKGCYDMLCIYCKEPRTQHGPFARCTGGRSQFMSHEDFERLLMANPLPNPEFAESEMQGIIQMEILAEPMRARVCRRWLELHDYDDEFEDLPDKEVCQKVYNILEKRAFPD